jgi:uncharacterized membrane protein
MNGGLWDFFLRNSECPRASSQHTRCKFVGMKVWFHVHTRVIRKVIQIQHQNPEFGHTQGEIFKNHAKKYISIQLREPSILMVNWVSSCLSFFLSASTAATYIFTAPTSTNAIISLEPCALNAEFQHFILCGYHWKKG